MINEIKDLKAKMDVVKCIAISGDGFDTVILPKGTFFNVPEKIGSHKIFESQFVESGKIIFADSNALDNYEY